MGLLETNSKLLDDEIDAVLSATIIAFGFVNIHPFVDGNGRIHRYLVHHILAKKSFSLEILIKNMPIYGIIAAVLFLYFEWDVPGYLENTTFLLTYATIFLVLMSLGIALTKLRVVSWTHASILGAVRVIVGPIIGFSLIKFLNLEGFSAGVLLIQSAMPSAVLTYLVGSMYSEKKVVDNVASVIVSSTLMSFITVPIVVYYSLKFFQ